MHQRRVFCVPCGCDLIPGINACYMAKACSALDLCADLTNQNCSLHGAIQEPLTINFFAGRNLNLFLVTQPCTGRNSGATVIGHNIEEAEICDAGGAHCSGLLSSR